MKNATRIFAVFVLAALGVAAFAQAGKSTQPAMPPTISSEDLKSLGDLADRLTLDNAAYQTEIDQATANDPIVKQARQLIAKRMAALPDVQETRKQGETDLAAYQAKLEQLRAAAKLDSSWEINANTGQWIQKPMPPPTVAAK